MKAATSYQKDLINDLKNKKTAIAYLNAALVAPTGKDIDSFGTPSPSAPADGNKQAFLLALRNMAEAQGDMAAFARSIGINRVSLYKITSGKGNLSFKNILSILQAVGMTLKVAKQ